MVVTISLGGFVADQMWFAQSAGAVEYTDSKTPPNECPAYDTKQSDGEVPGMLELWGMRCTPSLPLLPGPIGPYLWVKSNSWHTYAKLNCLTKLNTLK